MPLVGLLAATVVAIFLALSANGSGAGKTQAVSTTALASWLVGAVGVLLVFAWFRSTDARNRADRWFTEPSWRPALVARVLTVVGWVAGSWGALMIAESLARR